MIRIIIVDDQKITREAVNAILTQEPDFQLVAQAAEGQEALHYIGELRPDIALVDLEMPTMDGFILTKKVEELFPKTKVVILSSREDRDSINRAVNAGARGYLLKSTSGKEIADTIRYVQRGYFQLGPGLFETLISDLIGENTSNSQNLDRFKQESKKYFAELEKEINLKNNQTRENMFRELESQVNNLKREFRSGLENFQYRVNDRIDRGMDAFSQRIRHDTLDPNVLEKRLNARDMERQKQLSSMMNGTQKSITDLENKITVLRYGLIFLGISFFVQILASRFV